MKTTSEAAELLGISPRRVTALIQSGRIEAHKVGGIWLIDNEVIESRVKTVQKRGGRPRKGEGDNESRYLLKNRTHDIAELAYNSTLKEFTWVGPLLDASRAPIGLANKRGVISAAALNNWWRNRGIPVGRPALITPLTNEASAVPFELAVRNLGLSLSDQCWICPEQSGLLWHDLNFFNNDFEDYAFLNPQDSKSPALRHPDNTSDGVLPKHWVIRNKVRKLLKGSRFLSQEPYNEVVATKLHGRLMGPLDFVSYELEQYEGVAVSSCQLFLTDQEEFVSAEYVMRTKAQANHHNEYQHYLECCYALGVQGIEQALAHMIVADDILANTDRHLRNFGIIRDVETLACRPAPIFDSGTSLWCTKSIEELRAGSFDFSSKPFHSLPSRQLNLVFDLSWIPNDALDGFTAEAVKTLSENSSLEQRIPFIEKALELRVERICNLRKYL